MPHPEEKVAPIAIRRSRGWLGGEGGGGFFRVGGWGGGGKVGGGWVGVGGGGVGLLKNRSEREADKEVPGRMLCMRTNKSMKLPA